MSYDEVTEGYAAIGKVTSDEEIYSYSQWISNFELEWYGYEWTSEYFEGLLQAMADEDKYSSGVQIMKVGITDSADSSVKYLYYSVLMGIDTDPAVNTESTDFTVGYNGIYNVEYTPEEKTQLLSEYKRYAEYGSDEGTEMSEAIQNSVSNLISTTLSTLVNSQGMFNFKKTPHRPQLTNKLYSLSDVTRVTTTNFTGSAGSAETASSTTTTATRSGTTSMGGY
jgi:hypothetical protein